MHTDAANALRCATHREIGKEKKRKRAPWIRPTREKNGFQNGTNMTNVPNGAMYTLLCVCVCVCACAIMIVAINYLPTRKSTMLKSPLVVECYNGGGFALLMHSFRTTKAISGRYPSIPFTITCS